MIDKLITVGDKLELRAIHSIKDNSESLYASKIMDITSDDELKIAVPIEKGQIIPLSIGDKYSMFVYAKKGLYQCNIEIIGRYKELNLHILKAKCLTKLTKYQRRQYYRVDCLLDITYQSLNKIETELIEVEKGIITDISGGGARFTSLKPLKTDDKLMVNIVLAVGPSIKELNVESSVISSDPSIKSKGHYVNRVEFLDLMKEERECIIKFIFEEERKLIQKGKSQK